MRWALLISDGVILGLRPPVRPRARAAIKPAWVRSLMRGGFVLGHEGEHAEDEAAVRGGGVHDAVGQRPDPDPAGLQGGDDVDEVAQVAPEPVDFPDDQGVAAAQVGQAGVPLGSVGFGSGGGFGVGLQAVRGAEGVELQLGVLVGGGHPCVSDSVAHGHAHYRNPWPRECIAGLILWWVSGEVHRRERHRLKRCHRVPRIRSFAMEAPEAASGRGAQPSAWPVMGAAPCPLIDVAKYQVWVRSVRRVVRR